MDNTVRVWEASTGKALHVLESHTGAVTSVAVGHIGDREVVVAGDDGALGVRGPQQEAAKFRGQSPVMRRFTFAAEGRIPTKEGFLESPLKTFVRVCSSTWVPAASIATAALWRTFDEERLMRASNQKVGSSSVSPIFVALIVEQKFLSLLW